MSCISVLMYNLNPASVRAYRVQDVDSYVRLELDLFRTSEPVSSE